MLPHRCNPVLSVRRFCRTSVVLLGLAFVQVVGCASGSHTVKPPAPEHREVQVDRLVVTSGESLTAFELFERGRRELDARAFEAAARDFDLVVDQDESGPWTEEALYAGARAHEETGRHAQAAARFERVAREFETGELAREAHLRAVRLYVFCERYAEAAALSERFAGLYSERAPREELVVQSAIALGELENRDAAPEARSRALSAITKARGVIDRYQLDSAGHIPRDLAQVYYAKAELLRLEGEAVGFEPMPTDFADQFERRAQLLLDAQSAYSDVMRAYDAHWTAMAGFRVGELYKRLHQDVMSAPRPPGADTEHRKLVFEAALRLRYSVLLKKGLAMMDHTLAMAERTGESSQWVERTKQERQALLAAYATEQAAVDACPYSRADIEAVLTQIALRNKRP